MLMFVPPDEPFEEEPKPIEGSADLLTALVGFGVSLAFILLMLFG